MLPSSTSTHTCADICGGHRVCQADASHACAAQGPGNVGHDGISARAWHEGPREGALMAVRCCLPETGSPRSSIGQLLAGSQARLQSRASRLI